MMPSVFGKTFLVFFPAVSITPIAASTPTTFRISGFLFLGFIFIDGHLRRNGGDKTEIIHSCLHHHHRCHRYGNGVRPNKRLPFA